MNYIYFYFILLLIGISSCQYSKDAKAFSTSNISLKYPSYIFETNDVFPDKRTILQLKNDYRDVYFIVVDHGQKPGAQGFDMMCDSILKMLKKNMKEPNIEAKDSSFTINNLNVREFQISGVLSSEKQDHRFHFVIDVFETPNGHIYQTAGWLLRHKRERWLKDLQNAAYTFTVKTP